MSSIPSQAWTRRLDQTMEKPGKSYIPLSPGFILKSIPLAIRMSGMIRENVAGWL